MFSLYNVYAKTIVGRFIHTFIMHRKNIKQEIGTTIIKLVYNGYIIPL
jgi:hypothetical protein